MINSAIAACRGDSSYPPQPDYAFCLVALLRKVPPGKANAIAFTCLANACSAAGDFGRAQEVWTTFFRSASVSASGKLAKRRKQQKLEVAEGDERLQPDGAAFAAGVTAFAGDDRTWRTAIALLHEAERIVDATYVMRKEQQTKGRESRSSWRRRLKQLSPPISAYRDVRCCCNLASTTMCGCVCVVVVALLVLLLLLLCLLAARIGTTHSVVAVSFVTHI